MKKAITLVMLLFAAVTAMAQTWQNVGSPGFSEGNTYSSKIAIDPGGVPYVMYRDSGVGGKAIVKRFNGTFWENVGAAVSPQEVIDYDIAFDHAGTLYAVYESSGTDDDQLTVKKFNGTSWQTIGLPNFTPSISDFPSLAFDAANTPYVAYEDWGHDYKASVMKFNGTSWVNVGAPGFSGTEAFFTSLAIDSSGTPYVAFSDWEGNGKATVMKFNGTSWENVGAPEFTAGIAESTSPAIDSNNVPYLAYVDWDNDNKAAVVKFNGTSWVSVGIAGLSAGTANGTNLVLNASNTPYVVYRDNANSGKATVMKFNGTSWENVGTAGFSAGEIYAPFIALNASGTPYVSYTDASIGNKPVVMAFTDPVCEDCPPTTQLAPDYCGITTSQFSDLLVAVPVPSAQQYRFRASDGSVTNVVTRNDNIFRINMLPTYAYNTTYSIDVAAKVNDQWGEYGTVCTVTTPAPPVTQLRLQDCGATVASFSTGIFATPVPLAEGYRFRVTTGTFVQTVDRPDNSFRLNQLGEYNYVTTYEVAVSVKTNGVYGPYGPTCNVTSPSIPLTQLNSGFCNTTIGGFNYGIYANPVSLAEAYRFRVTNGANVQIITNGQYYFRLDQLSGYQYGITYTVEVAARSNGVYGSYGPSCTITAPPYPLTQLTTASCNSTVSSFETPLYANPIYSSEGYRFKVTNGANVEILNRGINHFRLDMLPSYQYGVTYTVEVATTFNGAYGPYGPACTVTAPAAPLTKLNDASCNSTVTSFSTSLNAISVGAAEGYRFRVVNGANVQTIEGTNSYFRLNQLGTYQYDTTYTVTVAIKIDGTYGSYGPACTVTSPAAQHTQLNSASCNITVPDFSMNLYATSIPSVTGYRFRVTNGANVQTIEGTASYFRLNQLASYQYSTVYTVDVAVSTGGIYGSYGTACTVTTPAPPLTQLRTQDCGITVASFGTNVYADEVILAEGYRFRVTHGATVDIVDWPTRNFRVKMLPVYTYNTTYSIEVAVMINGVYGPYGSSCDVSTPASGTRQNMANDEDAEVIRELTVFPNPFETSFTLALETESDEPVHIQAYDISGKILDDMTVSPEELVKLQVGSLYAAGIYSVIVSQGSYSKVVKIVKK